MKKKCEKEKKEGRILSSDWAYYKENEAFYDGKKSTDKVKLKKGDILLTENIPAYKAKEYFEKGVRILTCHTMSSKEHRDLLGHPRLHHYKNDGHETDALVIWDLYNKKPKLFYPYTINEMKILFSNFIQIQKARIASGNRAWSKEAIEMTNSTIQFLEQAEKETTKVMDRFGQKNIIYQYLTSIVGIGPRTGCGLLALADSTRFERESQLRRYAGLSVIDGGVQRFKAGESNGYDPELKALLIKRIGDSFVKSSGMKNPSAYFLDLQWEKERLQKLEPMEINIDDERKIVGDLLAESIPGFKKGDRVYKKNYLKLKNALQKLKRKTVLMRLSDGHIHARAVRKMVQMMLEDYWVISRQLQGFSTVPPYATTVLQHANYRKPRYIPKILEPFNPIRETGWIFQDGRRPWGEACPYIKDKCNK